MSIALGAPENGKNMSKWFNGITVETKSYFGGKSRLEIYFNDPDLFQSYGRYPEKFDSLSVKLVRIEDKKSKKNKSEKGQTAHPTMKADSILSKDRNLRNLALKAFEIGKEIGVHVSNLRGFDGSFYEINIYESNKMKMEYEFWSPQDGTKEAELAKPNQRNRKIA